MKITKKHFMNIHTYLSLFFLPIAIIYAITGALYILDIRENALADIKEIKLDSMAIKDLVKDKEGEFILETLKQHGLKLPSDTSVRNFRGAPTMGNVSYNVSLIKEKSGKYTLKTIDRSIYGILLLMHKSKGKYYFDILAIAFSISLLLFYLSGLIVTSFAKKNRKAAIITMLSGFCVTAIAVYLSI